MSKLSTVLDRQNWQWLQDENMEAANALEEDVASGKDSVAIRREMVDTIGAHRMGLISRCESAARHLERQKQASKN